MGGGLGGREQHIVKLLRREVKAVGVLPVLHGDGEREHLDVQLLPQGGWDVGGGVCGKFDACHRQVLL